MSQYGPPPPSDPHQLSIRRTTDPWGRDEWWGRCWCGAETKAHVMDRGDVTGGEAAREAVRVEHARHVAAVAPRRERWSRAPSAGFERDDEEDHARYGGVIVRDRA